MFTPSAKFAGWLALILMTLPVYADGWNDWGAVYIPNLQFGTSGAQLATDGTNLYYSTILDGVYRASLVDRQFSPMPLTGFPLWDANTNTNGFEVSCIAATPQGTVVISGVPVNVNTNTISPPPNPFNNSLPVFYWWDETNQIWHSAAISAKTYPYTSSVGNFSIAADGSLWACSGYYSYAYRSTDGGHSYTAFDINARVPTNYFPIPYTGCGKVFSIVTGWANEVVIGTESGGYLHTTNNGRTWTSLDPNFASTNTLNPLGRVPDASVLGITRQGDFLCGGSASFSAGFLGANAWRGVSLIGWHPANGSYYAATNWLPSGPGIGPSRVVTPASGLSCMFMNQNYLLQGGVYVSADGVNWTQFNQGTGLDYPFAPGITNAVTAGNCLTAVGNLVLIANGRSLTTLANDLESYDSTPPPVTNHPPVALPQNVSLLKKTTASFALTGADADGDALNFTVTVPPASGILGGSAPHLTYTPSNSFTGADRFLFEVDDGMATSAPVVVNLIVNPAGVPPPVVSLASSANGGWVPTPTSLVLSATASDASGLKQVFFYYGTNLLATLTNAPYVCTWTNPPAGTYVFNVGGLNQAGAGTWALPLTVAVLPAAPAVSIRPVDPTDVAVTWPVALNGFLLETAPAPGGPWTLCPSPPFYYSSGQTTTVPVAGQQVFRLMHP